MLSHVPSVCVTQHCPQGVKICLRTAGLWLKVRGEALLLSLSCLCWDGQHLTSADVVSVNPAGCGASESTQAAHQTAEGSAQKASAERRSQLGDEIQEREPEHDQV